MFKSPFDRSLTEPQGIALLTAYVGLGGIALFTLLVLLASISGWLLVACPIVLALVIVFKLGVKR